MPHCIHSTDVVSTSTVWQVRPWECICNIFLCCRWHRRRTVACEGAFLAVSLVFYVAVSSRSSPVACDHCVRLSFSRKYNIPTRMPWPDILSQFEHIYRVYVLVSARLAYAMRFPFWRSAAPSPVLPASHSMTNSLCGSYHARTGLSVDSFFTIAVASSCSLVHCHGISGWGSLLVGSVTLERPGRNFDKYQTVPGNLWNTLTFVRFSVLRISSVFFSSGFRPSLVTRSLFHPVWTRTCSCSMEWTELVPVQFHAGFATSLQQHSQLFETIFFITPEHHYVIGDTYDSVQTVQCLFHFPWKILALTFIQNGRRFHWYLSNGVMMVVSKLLSRSSSQYQ